MFACHPLQFPKDADFSYYKNNRSIKILEINGVCKQNGKVLNYYSPDYLQAIPVYTLLWPLEFDAAGLLSLEDPLAFPMPSLDLPGDAKFEMCPSILMEQVTQYHNHH